MKALQRFPRMLREIPREIWRNVTIERHQRHPETPRETWRIVTFTKSYRDA